MGNLIIINKNGQLVTDSREVAEMLGKRHSDLLETIKGYIEHLANGNFRSLDFFIESTYLDIQGKERPCYLLTRKGCDMVANKTTGEKGVLFTAAYVTKFEEMEKQVQAPKEKTLKDKEIEARYNNSLSRKANTLLKIANNPNISKEYVQVLQAKATEILTGQSLLPLPKAERKTLSAEEVGKILGISANKVGRIANEHSLKTEKYGKLFHDKSKYSSKEVESFRYYEEVIPILRNLI